MEAMATFHYGHDKKENFGSVQEIAYLLVENVGEAASRL